MNPVIVRPIRESDCDDVFALAQKSKDGLTSLPKQKKQLMMKIYKSIQSFSSKISEPYNEFYFFVMEDLRLKKVIGVCSITAAIGVDDPFFAFERQCIKKESWCLKKEVSVDVLRLVQQFNGPSEIGTLFLDPDYRIKGLGRLLSLSRFLYISRFPHRFKSSIIAEMRGVNENGESPFWNHVISHFFDMPFSEADQMSAYTKSFISELIPKYPIYINLLHKEAQKVIGKVHSNTVPALKLLLGEGFRVTRSVDIFDAGPKVEVQTNQLRFNQELMEYDDVKFSRIDSDSPLFMCCSGDESDFVVTVCNKNKNTLYTDRKLQKYIAGSCFAAPLYPKKLLQDLKRNRNVSKATFVERFYQWYTKVTSTLTVNG